MKYLLLALVIQGCSPSFPPDQARASQSSTLEDRLDRIERLIHDQQDRQMNDRKAVREFNDCNAQCDLIPRDYSDKTPWEETERGKCNAKCVWPRDIPMGC